MIKRNKVAEMKEVISKLVPLLTNKGLKVTQIGTQAFVRANPKTKVPYLVNIPNIGESADDSLIESIQGFIDHEIGHVLVTDWKYYGGGLTQEQTDTKEGQALSRIHNIVEDTMIEREMAKIFPGSRGNISKMRRHFIEKITKPAIASASDEKEKFLYLLVPIMRSLAGHDEFTEYLDEQKIWDLDIVKEFVSKISADTLRRLPKLNNTRDTLEVAKEVFDVMYKEPEKPEEPEDQDKSGDCSDDGDKSEPDEKGESSGSDPSSGQSDADEDKDGSEKDSDAGGDSSADSDDDDAEPEDSNESEGEGGDDGEGEDEKSDEESGSSGSDKSEDEDGEDEKDDGSDDDSDEGSDDGDSDAGDEADDDKSESGGVGSQPDVVPDEDESPEQGESIDEDTGKGDSGAVEKSMFDIDTDDLVGKDFSEQIGKIIEEAAIEAAKVSDWNVLTTDFDAMEPAPISTRKELSSWVTELDEEVLRMTGKMRKDVERMMASQSHVQNIPGFRRGKLHGPSLWRVTQADDRVFTKRHIAKSKDTAVSLVIDNSGSMRGHKMSQAMKAAYALAATLDSVNIAHEIMGFTTGGYSGSRAKISAKEREDIYQETLKAYEKGIYYDRDFPLALPIYKAFSEKMDATVKKRIATSINAQSGLAGNVDGESLMIISRRLLARQETRKVMIVLSDGQPVGGRDPDGHLKGVVKYLTECGIDMVGIGIQSKAVRNYYDNCVTINNASELPGQVMKQIVEILS